MKRLGGGGGGGAVNGGSRREGGSGGKSVVEGGGNGRITQFPQRLGNSIKGKQHKINRGAINRGRGKEIN